MSSNRPVVLSDFFDVNPKRSLAKGHESTFVSMADLAEHQRSISSWTKRPFKSGSRFQNGDVLVARITPCLENGKTAFVDILDEGAVGHGSTEFIVLAARDGAADPMFGYYLATSPRFRDYATSRMIGSSGRQRVSAGEVGEYRLEYAPTLDEQRAIAEALGSLDTRIEWAQAARLKVLDCAHAVWASESTAESRDITVGDIAMFHNRRRIPLSARERESRPGPYPYYGATGQFGSVNDYLFDGNFVLVGEDGSVVNLDGTPIVQYVSNRFWVNNHAHVLTSEELTPEELFLALQRVNVSGYVTGAAQPKLSMGRLKQVPISLPLRGSIEQARPTIAALFESFRGLAGEVEVLRTTRDALLPKLVSGEIRIEDPERLLDQVA